MPIEVQRLAANRAAWEALGRWERPVLCVFGTRDPILGKFDAPLISHIPGAAGQPHARIHAGHFIQEDADPELARRLIKWEGLSDPAAALAPRPLTLEVLAGPVETDTDRDPRAGGGTSARSRRSLVPMSDSVSTARRCLVGYSMASKSDSAHVLSKNGSVGA